jgi:hypothetical protein
VPANERVGQLVLSPYDPGAVSLQRRRRRAGRAEALALVDEPPHFRLQVLHVGRVRPQSDVHTERYRHRGRPG